MIDMMRTTRAGAGAVFSVTCAAIFAIGCSGGGTPAPMACSVIPVSQRQLAFDLAGAYTVTVIATSGAYAGQSAEGSITLSAGGGDGAAFTGHSSIDLTSLGAVNVGSMASTDPEAPGIVVQTNEDAGEIMMRFGAEANRSGRMRFDGGYTVFRVQHVAGGRIAGEWVSGTSRDVAGGHFCGKRS